MRRREIVFLVESPCEPARKDGRPARASASRRRGALDTEVECTVTVRARGVRRAPPAAAAPRGERCDLIATIKPYGYGDSRASRTLAGRRTAGRARRGAAPGRNGAPRRGARCSGLTISFVISATQQVPVRCGELGPVNERARADPYTPLPR